MKLLTGRIQFFKRHGRPFLENMTIRKRLMLFFSLIIILPLIGISIVNYDRFSSYVRDITIKQKFDTSKSAMAGIGIIKERDEKISDQILSNPMIQDALIGIGTFPSQFDKLLYDRQISSLLSSMVDSTNVTGILVVGINGREYSSSTSIIRDNFSDDIDHLLAREDLQISQGGNIWIPMGIDIFKNPNEASYNKAHLYIVRKISNVEFSKYKLGYSIVQLDYNRVYEILRGTALEDKGEYSVLLDQNGTIMCHTEKRDKIGTKIENEIYQKMNAGMEGSFFEKVNGEDYLMLYARDNDSGWAIVQGIPYRNILEKSKEIRNFTIGIMLLFLTLALIMSVIFSRNITYPIIKLKNVMDKFGAGDLTLRTEIDRNDEIGKLQQSFNIMADDIRNLLNKIEDENKRRRILELNLLEYQINPHFLYNTLDSINWMAQKSGQNDISEMVTALARFFRVGLSKGKEFIKIQDELQHAESYLIINKIRFKDWFEYKFSINREILQYKTIKLILQPIIENAIKHGMDKNKKNGLIEIKGSLEKDKVILTVSDNGKGIEENDLSTLQKLLESTSSVEDYGGGIGLINVNQRIKLNFGAEYGLTIDSRVGYGTTVSIRIPCLKD